MYTSPYLCKDCRTLEQAERDIANDHAKYRAAANNRWDMPAFTAAGKPKPIILAETTGPRVSVRSPIPHIQLPANTDRRRQFEADLCKYFGGFTSYSFAGGWVSPSGETMIEKGRIYEVSGDLSTFEADLARMLICKLGMDLGEQWMHIEVHHFDALHSQVNEPRALTVGDVLDREDI